MTIARICPYIKDKITEDWIIEKLNLVLLNLIRRNFYENTNYWSSWVCCVTYN